MLQAWDAKKSRDRYPAIRANLRGSYDRAMTPRGFEQSSKTNEKPHITPPPNTESNTVVRELQTVIDAWANVAGACEADDCGAYQRQQARRGGVSFNL